MLRRIVDFSFNRSQPEPEPEMDIDNDDYYYDDDYNMQDNGGYDIEDDNDGYGSDDSVAMGSIVSNSTVSTKSSRSSGEPSIKAPSSVTSYTVDSNRSSTPMSIMSIDSSMQFFRTEFGRDLNNSSDVYHLPGDEEELKRLDLQHEMFKDIFGEKYPRIMAEYLQPKPFPSEKMAVVDFGCGAGSWITDVARDFPHVDCVGVDLIPLEITDRTPHNLRYEVDDLNLGLEHFFNDFDIAHCRLIAAGIKDYHRVIYHLGQVVKPGGIIMISEFDFYIYNLDQEAVIFPDDFHVSPPFWGRWMQYLHDAIKLKGGDVTAANNLFEWVSACPFFEDAHYEEHWLPIVALERTGPRKEFWEEIDEMMRVNLTSFLASGRPLLLGNGMPLDFIEMLEGFCVREIAEKRFPQFTRLQVVTARRRLETNNELPPRPPHMPPRPPRTS